MSLYKYLLVSILATSASSKLVARQLYPDSAATKTQIKFAEENNYDQTGPGSKEPEGAYKTYKTLEEVLIGYLDDPDTKLPESERQKAYYHYTLKPSLLGSSIQSIESTDIREPAEIPTPVRETFGTIHPTYNYENKKYYLNPFAATTLDKFAAIDVFDYDNFAKIHKIKKHPRDEVGYRPRPIDVNVAATSRSSIKTTIEQNYQENPQYTYSYGVHDRMTGDSKSVHETRNGDTVLGFYTFMEPDGQQRTVRYTADDKNGFNAIVERTPANRGPS